MLLVSPVVVWFVTVALGAPAALVAALTLMAAAAIMSATAGFALILGLDAPLAVLADKADFDVVVFFAVGQLPMYILPALLRPLYRRLMRAG